MGADMTEARRTFSFTQMAVAVAAVCIILAAVYGASHIISQFLMAFVVVVALSPVQNWLIGRGLKPVAAFLITVIGMLIGIGLFMVVLTASLNQFLQDLPQYKEQLSQTTAGFKQALESIGMSSSTAEAVTPPSGQVAAFVASAAAWLLGAFTSFGFMLALAAFMLFESTVMPEKIRAIALPPRREPLDRFVGNVRNYVVVTAWVNFLVAAVNTTILLFMHIPYAVLWGVLSFLFGFIPSIGFMLSLVGPALMALLTSGPQAATIVVVSFIVINGGIQNIVLPRQMGEGTDLSPAIVFGSLLFWGFILGPVGAILSVPMTMIVRLALESSEATLGLSYLISSGKHQYRRLSD